MVGIPVKDEVAFGVVELTKGGLLLASRSLIISD
jgi:hypothetical protein